MRLMVAVAAPVTIFVAPGPMELMQASVFIGDASLRMPRRCAPWPVRCGTGSSGDGDLLQRLADARDIAVAEDPNTLR